jgi:hypothetical protein
MEITQYYVNPAIAGNSGTGTIGDPFGDLQYALDTVGAGVGRNATDGDQFNIKAGTAEILAASLTLATYGTPTAPAPLILRGYTAAANDGGMGEIDCGGFTMWAATTYNYIMMCDLEMHTFGDNSGIVLDTGISVYRCYVHKGSSIWLRTNCMVYASHIDAYGTGTGIDLCVGANSIVCANYVKSHNVGIYHNGIGVISIGNVIVCPGNTIGIMYYNDYGLCGHNLVYAETGNSKCGVCVGIDNRAAVRVYNNIICNFSGAGGSGIDMDSSDASILGYNAFYNNTANYADLSMVFIDGRANDVALGADPFTNAAAGDFSLTAAAKTALAGKGFPVDYLGAAAATVSNLNIGPIQLAATAPVAATRGRLIIPRR